jgi:glutamate-1-semialdehyde 2,1-aminomutase
MDESLRLFNKASKLIPKGVNSPIRYFEPYPFFVKRAKGCKVYDVDNNSYIDYCMGYGSLLLGHAFKDVIDEVKSQLYKGSLYCMPSEQEVELAELLNRCIPSAEMVRLVNTGLEATYHAIRIARAYTKRSKVVRFEGCYHGANDYTLADKYVPECIRDSTLIVPYNDINALDDTMSKHGDDVACIIVEPVMANAGLILPEEGYLSHLSRVAKEHGSLLIFDEVVTGFRLALGGAQEYYGVKPDLSTFAKAMSNGFTIACIAGREDVMSILAPKGDLFQASTFAGNPVGVTASIATIRFLLKHRSLYKRLEKRCKYVTDSTNDIINDMGISASVNSIASIFQIFFTAERVNDYAKAKKASIYAFKEYFNSLLKQGVFIPPSQFEVCFISYMHDEKALDYTINAIEAALKEVKGKVEVTSRQ